jgi:DNA-directed RNA polymerase subunit RPC12/RpoP
MGENMSKFVEINEDALCPKCGGRLFLRRMPPRSKYDMMRDQSCFPMTWWYSKCDRYFEEQKEGVREKPNVNT